MRAVPRGVRRGRGGIGRRRGGDALIEYEDEIEVDGDAEGRRRRRATARVLAAALEKPEAPLADASPRGMFPVKPPPVTRPPAVPGGVTGGRRR